MSKFIRNLFFILAVIGLIIAVGCAVDEGSGASGSSGTITLTGTGDSVSSVSSADVVVVSEASSSAESSSSESIVSSEISSDSSSVASTPFGETTGVSEPYLTAEIFNLIGSKNSTDCFDVSPSALLYSKKINVPIRAYSAGFPGASGLTEYFGVKYSGTLKAPVTGEYKFILVCDDGASMSIDGNNLAFTKKNKTNAGYISYSGYVEAGYTKFTGGKVAFYETGYVGSKYNGNINSQHAAGLYVATVNLTAGQDYSFILKYFQGPKEEIACWLKVALPGESAVDFDMDLFK